MAKKPLMLMILDGWGCNPNKDEKNAIKEAHPENFIRLYNKYPHTFLKASGEAVGLPDGQMGNSEVGHLNLGAGRVIYQPLVEISKEIRDGEFFEREEIISAFNYAKENDKKIHFIGLTSNGGVHSHITHLYGLLEMAKKKDLSKVSVHTFMDGRDTAPDSGVEFIKELEEKILEIGVGKIASMSGRYYAMDRDNNWDRIEKAYNAIVGIDEVVSETPIETLEKSYAEKITDEFVLPVLFDKEGAISEGDVVINFNFRPDRAREITRALNDKEFSGFKRKYLNLQYYCMRQYDSTIDAFTIYHDREIVNTLGEVISKNGLTQLRTAETEKYAHVTFFFNGGKESEFKGEGRKLIASPKVATYDLQPEMSAPELTKAVLEILEKNEYDVMVMNYANPDMVGHTGVFSAATQAIKVVDENMAKVVNKILELDGTILITADHGNAEKMEDPKTHNAFTAHTTYEVPMIYVSNHFKGELNLGKLADIAPTMLDILNIKKPKEMNGESLIKK